MGSQLNHKKKKNTFKKHAKAFSDVRNGMIDKYCLVSKA